MNLSAIKLRYLLQFMFLLWAVLNHLCRGASVVVSQDVCMCSWLNELNLRNTAKASIVALLINEWQTKWSSSAECASAFWREAGAEFSSPGMKAINVIERSGISWLSYMATHGNDRQYHVTGTDYVRLQTKDRLFDSRAADRVEKHGPPPAPSPPINFFLLFPCPAHISSLPCCAVTSKLLFGYERLSGNRPFYRVFKGGRDGAGLGAEGRNYHISGCTGVPPFGTDTKTPQSYHSSESFSFGTIGLTFI